MKTFEEIVDETTEHIRKLGAAEEQNRILRELDKIVLPPGTWSAIRHIFGKQDNADDAPRV